MSLLPGNKLGPYEILSALGAGGMGEVYKARDLRLDRSVAVKVLPEHIAQREDVRARFEREARAVASLNHPNICTLHDIGIQDGTNYIVMELMEGETLSSRIEKGPIPLDQALKLGLQIADALDRAHRAGVTHRDVKPQNIMLTRDGVKVLDFGLAKSTAKQAPVEETITRVLTSEGTVVGTPQYMAPEQFEGKEADARADIWAFGAVLYEMVTGQKAFQGKTYATLVGAILATEPAPMSVKPMTPSWLERLVRRCLAKDPEDRWQSMRDIVLELRAPPQEAQEATPVASSSRWPWLLAAAGLISAAVLAGILLTGRRATAEAAPMEFELKVPGGLRTISVSPNGKLLAWRDDNNLDLWIRSLDSNTPRKVDGSNPLSISWSPDSRYLAYITQTGLKKLDVTTSSIQTLAPMSANTNYGLDWTNDGYILMGVPRGPLMKIRSTGGPIVPALQLDESAGELSQRGPVVLPDGERVLYQSNHSNPETSGIYLARLDGKGTARRVFKSSVGHFRFVTPNILLTPDSGGLLAVPIDLKSGEAGEPFTVANTEVGTFSASLDGRVLAIGGRRQMPEELNIYDRSGKKLDTLTNAVPISTAHLEFSPDGRRLLLERNINGNTDLWTVELERKVVSRLTFHETTEGPGVWSADGRTVYFRAVRPGLAEGIFEIPSDGTGTEKLVHKTATHHMHASLDGKYLLFETGLSGAGLSLLELQNGNKPSVYLSQPASSPQFSPDGRFVAYESVATGRSEVYVQTFPLGDGKWQISASGGIEPRWRGDGKELFYDKGDGTVMAVEIDTRGKSLQVISTKELFKFRHGRSAGTALAVTPDGKTFAIRESPVGGELSILLKLNAKLTAK